MINLSLVKSQHLIWTMKMNGFVNGKENEPSSQELVSHRECAFGKWLYTKGLSEYSQIAELRQVEKVHEELHAMGRQIIQLKQNGDLNAARQGIFALQEVSDRVMDLLDVIDHKIQTTGKK